MLTNNNCILEAKEHLGGSGSSLLEPYFKKTIEQGKKTIKVATWRCFNNS
jgi:hypothetical protein